jgi:hypothetical protein
MCEIIWHRLLLRGSNSVFLEIVKRAGLFDFQTSGSLPPGETFPNREGFLVFESARSFARQVTATSYWQGWREDANEAFG